MELEDHVHYVVKILQIFFEFLLLCLKAGFVMLEALFRCFVPVPQKSVQGEIVLITGAGQGVGKELALRFAALGATVVLWDINQESNEKVAEEIKNKGGNAFAYHCDVTDDDMIENLALQVRREVGDVTILINNAGILNCQPFIALNAHQIKKTVQVNLMAHCWTIRQFLPRMIETGRGHIVAIASIAGMLGTPNLTDYCASKFGVVGLMTALQEELYSMNKQDCIHLTTICPLTLNNGMAHHPSTRFPKLLPILDLNRAVDHMVKKILQNQNFVVIPPRVQFFHVLQQIAPNQVTHLFQNFLQYENAPHVPMQ